MVPRATNPHKMCLRQSQEMRKREKENQVQKSEELKPHTKGPSTKQLGSDLG
jgi:hypothetical protein